MIGSGKIPNVIQAKEPECTTAYRELCDAHTELESAVGTLIARLGPVTYVSPEGQDSEACPSQGPVSEVHGWLISATERTNAVASRLRYAAASLTI